MITDFSEKGWLEKSRDNWESFGVTQSGYMFDKKTFRGKLQLEELEWVISHIPEGAYKILDAGCGPGRYTQILIKKGLEVIGYDFSRNILGLLKQNLGMCASDTSFIQGDIQILPFKDDKFDVVFMLDVLHHLKTKEMRMSAIKDAFRVSNKYIFLDVKNLYNPYLWYRYKKNTDPFLRVAYTFSEIQNSIEKLGGNIIRKHSIGFPIKFVAPYILIEAIKSR